MYKTIIDKSNYIQKCDVEKLPINYEDIKSVSLFGKNIKVYNNEWLWHLHLKCTDICNANCSFCVEKSCRNNKQDPDMFLENIDKMLHEMTKDGILYSVSVTGGEPTVFNRFNDLLDILKKYEIKFLTMNSNAHKIAQYMDKINDLFDFVDISRHGFSDEENDGIFKTHVLTINELKEIKKQMNKTKMRIQCVNVCMDTIDDMLRFVDIYSFADDISIRRLMEVNDEYGQVYNLRDNIYTQMLDYAQNNWKFKEQTIQDYYVYEIYNNGSTDVTFSYSNMKMLRKVEKEEQNNIFREFIVHPNGCVSGSWMQDCKILLKGV